MCYCHSPTCDANSFMEELASCVNARVRYMSHIAPLQISNFFGFFILVLKLYFKETSFHVNRELT